MGSVILQSSVSQKPEVLVGTFDRPNLTYRVIQRTDKTAQDGNLGRHRKKARSSTAIHAVKQRVSKSLTTSDSLRIHTSAGLDVKGTER